MQEINNETWMIDVPFHGASGVLASYMLDCGLTTVIDPGPFVQARVLLDWLAEKGKRLDVVALTHIHLDHAAGTWWVVEKNPRAIVYVHPRGVRHLIDPSALLKAAEEQFKGEVPDYGEVKGVPAKSIRETVDGEVLELGDLRLRVVWSPGHSTHSQSFFDPTNRVLFAGDAAGHIIDGVMLPASPPPYNPIDALHSIDLFLRLKPEVLCISHFGIIKDAIKYLESFKERVELWNKLSYEAVDEGLGLRGLFSKVVNAEEKLGDLAVADSAVESGVYSSLAGFLSYARYVREKK